MKKAVITGGTGFIGLCLAKNLLKHGYEVHVTSRTGSLKNIEGVNHYQCDICDYDLMMKVCRGAEYIFHFAARSDQDCIDHPIETEHSNVGGTVTVLEVARQVGVKKIIFASSAIVYGNELKVPLSENFTVEPTEPYGLYKYLGEQLVHLWAVQYGVPAVSLRFFNVYGSGDVVGPDAFVVGRFLDKRIKGEPLTIDGDGSDTRDYVHVEDVASACILAAENENVFKGEVFNVGSGMETSLNDLAKHLGGEVTHLESRLGARRGPHRRVADITLAKQFLGWEPKISLEAGFTRLKADFGIV